MLERHRTALDSPRPLDQDLANAGALVRNRFPPFIPRVVRDRELLTGQDPFAAAKLGQRLAEAIAGG